MSLRAFHVVFIVLSILLAVWFAFWLQDRRLSALSLAVAALLAAYLFWFVRKTFLRSPR